MKIGCVRIYPDGREENTRLISTVHHGPNGYYIPGGWLQQSLPYPYNFPAGPYYIGPTVQTKPIYFAIFTNNIGSYLLWSPVIVVVD